MINHRISFYQSIGRTPFLFGIFVVSISVPFAMLFLFLVNRSLVTGLAWAAILIAVPAIGYALWKSHTSAVILLMGGLAFHAVFLQYWEQQSGGPGIRYWKEVFLFCLAAISVLRHFFSSDPQKPSNLIRARVFLAACLYVSFCCLRALFANDYYISLAGLANLVLYFLLFLVIVLAKTTNRQMSIIFNAMLLVVVTVGIIGIVEKMYGFRVLEGKSEDLQMYMLGERRITSTLGSTVSLGQFMGIGAGLSFTYLVTETKWRWRLFYGGCLAVCVITSFLTYTRGAYLQMIISIVVIGALLYGWRLATWRSTLVLLAVVLAFILRSGQVVQMPIVKDRFQRFFSLSEDPVNRERFARWEFYLNRITDDSRIMVWGNGLGTTSQWVLGGASVSKIVAESWPLKLAFEAGLAGVLLFYFMYFCCMWSCLSAFRKCERSFKPSVAAMFGIFAGLGVYSLFLQVFESWIISMCLWLLAGMVCVLDRRYADRPQGVAEIGGINEKKLLLRGVRIPTQTRNHLR